MPGTPRGPVRARPASWGAGLLLISALALAPGAAVAAPSPLNPSPPEGGGVCGQDSADITASPTTVAPGDPVTVSGQCFPGDRTVDLLVGNHPVTDPPIARSDGSFTYTFGVTATEDFSVVASASNAQRSVQIDVTEPEDSSAPPGTSDPPEESESPSAPEPSPRDPEPTPGEPSVSAPASPSATPTSPDPGTAPSGPPENVTPGTIPPETSAPDEGTREPSPPTTRSSQTTEPSEPTETPTAPTVDVPSSPAADASVVGAGAAAAEDLTELIRGASPGSADDGSPAASDGEDTGPAATGSLIGVAASAAVLLIGAGVALLTLRRRRGRHAPRRPARAPGR